MAAVEITRRDLSASELRSAAISAPPVEERLRGELARRMDAPEDTMLTELLRPVRRIELEREGVRIAFSLKDLPAPPVTAWSRILAMQGWASCIWPSPAG